MNVQIVQGKSVVAGIQSMLTEMFELIQFFLESYKASTIFSYSMKLAR